MVLERREQQAEVHVKGAHLAGGRHIVLKVATGFYRNRARGLPSGDGMFLLLDADTGVPAVLLEEHGYLTDFRTAAAVALTLKYLAPKDTHERSEEHTSELQSLAYLVCRLLLEKKK